MILGLDSNLQFWVQIHTVASFPDCQPGGVGTRLIQTGDHGLKFKIEARIQTGAWLMVHGSRLMLGLVLGSYSKE